MKTLVGFMLAFISKGFEVGSSLTEAQGGMKGLSIRRAEEFCPELFHRITVSHEQQHIV